jgi:hypothetical protein
VHPAAVWDYAQVARECIDKSSPGMFIPPC